MGDRTAYWREYYQRNKATIAPRHRAHWLANRDKYVEQKRRWRAMGTNAQAEYLRVKLKIPFAVAKLLVDHPHLKIAEAEAMAQNKTSAVSHPGRGAGAVT